MLNEYIDISTGYRKTNNHYEGIISVTDNGKWIYNLYTGITRLNKNDALLDAQKLKDDMLEQNVDFANLD